MNCLKCGREIPEDQLFCEGCLEIAEQYPVKPNTAVLLPPHRDTPSPVKKAAPKRRQTVTVEEKLQKTQRTLTRVLILWLLTLALLITAMYPAAKYLLGETFRLPGQNYSTISTIPTESAPAVDSATAPTNP